MVLFSRGFCLVLLGFLLGDFGVKKKLKTEKLHRTRRDLR